ncbi:MAG: MBL fold metallo-hydrolase [Acidobacteriota bacterium]|nr:MBL fold metallo-hydrolase [Acidobacteriota bacterium]MDE3043274.1 MBL fold metallo-hydrolase [Acidobacteriota bacterium]MDE3107452.1 MBL fold metallo-hydrolase [Acidobacteriota bacterium]MDE3222720.1 MBL fold metallo-hydrolase [Acidobacteriota bacterium]
MKVTLLGTGSPIPHPDHAGPATLVRGSDTALLFDCGRGVVTRLAAAGLVPSMLDTVFLTHLHSDHVSDLNDVITTHWVMNVAPRALRVVGPVGTAAFVDATLAAMSRDVEFRLAHHADLTRAPWVEVTEAQPGESVAVGPLRVRVAASDHRPVTPSLAYRVEHEATSVVIAGDGVPCATLDELLVGASAYVQTVVREDLVRAIPSTRLQDILDYHSSVAQAAASAQRAGVGALVMTHYVPPVTDETREEWRALARGFDGLVVVGDDLTTLDLATLEVSATP